MNTYDEVLGTSQTPEPTLDEQSASNIQSAPESTLKFKKASTVKQTTSTLALIRKQSEKAKSNRQSKVATKKIQVEYSLMKPKAPDFVRVHPDDAYAFFDCLAFKAPHSGDEFYPVHPDLDVEELPASAQQEIVSLDLYVGVTNRGDFFIWPVKVSNHKAYSSATKIAKLARRRWVRPIWSKATNSYQVIEPEDAIDEPDWLLCPSIDTMLESAFEGKFVSDADHPIIAELAGRRFGGDE